MVALIRRLLRSPSSFVSDPKGYALNQLGHTFLIGAAPVLVVGPWIVPVVLAAYVFWELWQFIHFEADAWDCIEDVAFVTGGVFCVLEPLMLLPLGLFLLAGAFRRSL